MVDSPEFNNQNDKVPVKDMINRIQENGSVDNRGWYMGAFRCNSCGLESIIFIPVAIYNTLHCHKCGGHDLWEINQ